MVITKGSDVKIGVILSRKNKLTGVSRVEDLAGKTVTAVYKDGANALVTLTVGGGGIEIEDAPYGEINLVLNDTQTLALAEGSFDFDVYVDDGPNRSIWRFIGKVTVEEKLT